MPRAEASPRPWRVVDYDQCPGLADVFDASGSPSGLVAGELKPADAALIVDAVDERDRLRAELADKTRNYEDVIAFHKRTEEYLRDLIKRLITVREKVFWRKDEKTGMTYEMCLMDEDEARKTIEEAKAAVKEDKE